MDINLDKYANCYLHLHADCIPVKGASRSTICDLTRNELIFFPSDYFEVLEYLLSDKFGVLLQAIECDDEKKLLLEFIEFLDQHELITFLEDPSVFPPLEERWEIPAVIQNAIIDVDSIYHDFEKIFHELDELGCQFVQLRSFSNLLKIEDLDCILSSAQHKSIQSIELLLKYDAEIPDADYINLAEKHPILSALILHSSHQERKLVVNYGYDEEWSESINKEIHLISQQITSQAHCGLISLNTLNAPTVSSFFETKLFNGCLNRKVSVDSLGQIKNCPSMPTSYGNVQGTSLSAAIEKTGFKEKWNITKDQIDTCKDCEFRYVCSDCRAYLENPENLLSKPLKCGYDPYTGQWEDWSQNTLKQKAMEHYDLFELLSKNMNIA